MGVNAIIATTPNPSIIGSLPSICVAVDMVYGDLERMTKSVLELFLDNGHTNIAYIGGYQIDINEAGRKSTTENEKRLRAYRHFMQDHHLTKQINYYLGEWTEESGEQLATKLLEKQKHDLPTAILIGSDPLALGVYRALQKDNRKIGEEIVLVSFDNIEAIADLSPSLTSVAINAKAIGQSAVRLAVERIDGLRDEPIIVTYPTRLIIRESFNPDKS